MHTVIERTAIEGTPTAADDEARFAEIYPTLRRFAAVTASPDVDADDLVQDALAATLQKHGSLDGVDNPTAYLRRCIINLESNHRRNRARERDRTRLTSIAETQVEEYPSDLADLNSLEPQQRAILYLFEVEGRTFRYIADLFDENESTIRRRATTARRTLRTRIQGETQP